MTHDVGEPATAVTGFGRGRFEQRVDLEVGPHQTGEDRRDRPRVVRRGFAGSSSTASGSDRRRRGRCAADRRPSGRASRRPGGATRTRWAPRVCSTRWTWRNTRFRSTTSARAKALNTASTVSARRNASAARSRLVQLDPDAFLFGEPSGLGEPIGRRVDGDHLRSLSGRRSRRLARCHIRGRAGGGPRSGRAAGARPRSADRRRTEPSAGGASPASALAAVNRCQVGRGGVGVEGGGRSQLRFRHVRILARNAGRRDADRCSTGGSGRARIADARSSPCRRSLACLRAWS